MSNKQILRKLKYNFIMTKEEFKQLRLEAGFKTDADFLRVLGYLSVNTANFWFNGVREYPKFLENVFFLFKLKQNFDKEQYEEFLKNLHRSCEKKYLKKGTKLKKNERALIEKSKIVSNGLTLVELRNKNVDLKKESEFLEELLFEIKKERTKK
ncbi:hypothetical protein MG150_000227 [Campylobacter upsaliensis]|nr:hypothetical protein [Campylobacter upsaliensis]